MAKTIKFVALHTIPFTITAGKAGNPDTNKKGTKPVVFTVNPKDRLMLDPEDAETKFLLQAKAVTKAAADDEVRPVYPAKKATATPASQKAAQTTPAKKAPEGGEGGEGGEGSKVKAVSDMTKAKIVDELTSLEIEFDESDNKPVLVELLEKARAGDDEELV